MNNQYMVEIWKDGKSYEPDTLIWYHATKKAAVNYCRSILNSSDVFVVLFVFDVGHYRTVHTEQVA